MDGVVVDGRSAVDESMVTGEPIPVEKEAGSKVTGGTINGTGSMTMRAERVGDDTLLAQIVRMVSEAQRTRAPIQRLADVIASYFVPAVVVAAIVAFLAWSVWGPDPRLAHALLSGGGRADHRLPLRARPGDADGDHGRARAAARRPACSSRTPRRSSGSRRSTRWWSTRPAR